MIEEQLLAMAKHGFEETFLLTLRNGFDQLNRNHCQLLLHQMAPEKYAKDDVTLMQEAELVVRDYIEQRYGFSKSDLNVKTRKADLVNARNLYMVGWYMSCKISMADLTATFERDHATFINSRKRLTECCERGGSEREEVIQMAEHLKARGYDGMHTFYAKVELLKKPKVNL